MLSARDDFADPRAEKRTHPLDLCVQLATECGVARALADETGASAEDTLYGDTVGPGGSAGATYLEMEAAKHARRGLNDREARRRAALAFGFTCSASRR